ncbi:Two-component signal transduction system YycFG, regulatory protein YycH [Paenibacillus sp. yr247]|uniref:YycH family regulatory protein n=1 Tax=Paenibacillus sp. yr247 TaxID=1761880 RepID=UPI00087F3CCF|nr:two-component system activity regulator YycH [Paenibacillus sp. yr247]SDO53438.1 Two-component signal transduction system YycFG, regulatory protein YycH [Paenibacillus sp. yr247]
MIESLKSILLVVLIGSSLYQSFLLASYNPPKIEPIQQSNYVQTETLGKPSELQDMLFPDQIIVHLGNQQHSVLYPNNYYYTRLLDNIKQRSFKGFRKTSMYLVNVNWEDVRTKQQGVEIRFRDGIPFTILQQLLRIEGEIPTDNDKVTRIWIYSKGNNEDVRAFFFTDSPGVGYEVIGADFTSKDVENFAAFGDLTNLYKTTNSGDYYLPIKPLRLPSYVFNYSLLTADQLKQSLFVDPGITRYLKERDGSEIYTDSKRGFQLNRDQRWITYSDPVAPVVSKSEVLEDLMAGIKFINQHIGWDGKYKVARTPQKQLFDNYTFTFRQYYESLPIIMAQPEGFGSMKMQVQKGIISGFERSMIIPDLKSVQRRDAELISGDALEEKLQYYQRRSSIISIFPAYRPIVSDKTFMLAATWTLELRDGTYDFIE